MQALKIVAYTLLLYSCAAPMNISDPSPSSSPTLAVKPIATKTILLPKPNPQINFDPEPNSPVALPIPTATPFLDSQLSTVLNIDTLSFTAETIFLNYFGEQVKLTIRAQDKTGKAIALPDHIIWVSDTPSKIDVDNEGLVTAKASSGQARITAKHLDSGTKATIQIVIRASSAGGSSGGGGASNGATTTPALPVINTVSTNYAGQGGAGFVGDFGPAKEASLDSPHGLVSHQNKLYIADAFNHRIRVIDINGIISPIAGTGDLGFTDDIPNALSQLLNFPHGLALKNDTLYVSDQVNGRIRAINLTTGIMTTFAGGGAKGDDVIATESTLSFPSGLAFSDDSLYIADTLHHRIRKINLQTNLISTVAGGSAIGDSGNGAQAEDAKLNTPQSIAIHNNLLYIADTLNHQVRLVDLDTGIIRLFAGNGTAGYNGDNGNALSASLNNPTGITVNSLGHVFIADHENGVVRMVNAQTQRIVSLNINGLKAPQSVTIDTFDNLYVSDSQNHSVIKVEF